MIQRYQSKTDLNKMSTNIIIYITYNILNQKYFSVSVAKLHTSK